MQCFKTFSWKDFHYVKFILIILSGFNLIQEKNNFDLWLAASSISGSGPYNHIHNV